MRPEPKKNSTPLKFVWEISTSIHQVTAYEGSPNWACKGCGCCGCCIGCIGCSCIGGWWTGGACCSGCGIGCIGWGIGCGIGCPPWTLAGAVWSQRVDGTHIKRDNLGGLVWFGAKTQNGFKIWAAGIKTNSMGMVLKLMPSNTLSRFKNDSTALSLPVHGDLKSLKLIGAQYYYIQTSNVLFLPTKSSQRSQTTKGIRSFDFADTAPEGAWSCTSPILGEKTPSKASLQLAASLNSNSAVAHSLAVQDQTEQNRC